MNEQQAWHQRLQLLDEKGPSVLRDSHKGESVLYVGATPWRFQMGRELHEAGYEITLLEAFRLYAQNYEGHPWLKDVICGDVRGISAIAGDRRWDVAIWWHGPEHVKNQELETTLRGLESVTERLVLLGCPWGVNAQGAVGSNPFERHWASLDVADLTALGYKTETLGHRNDPGTWCHIMAWKTLGEPLGIRAQRVGVYTAIFGDYDELQAQSLDGCTQRVFTDSAQLAADGWEVQVVGRKFQDPRLEARMYKALPHHFLRDVDVSVWIDGHGQLGVGVDQLLSYLGEQDMAVFAHPDASRNLDGEAEVIIHLGKGPSKETLQQVSDYYVQGLPSSTLVVATTLMVRRHSELIGRLNDAWLIEMMKYTVRDQLSLPFLCWKLGVEYSVLPGNLWENDLVIWHGHREQ